MRGPLGGYSRRHGPGLRVLTGAAAGLLPMTVKATSCFGAIGERFGNLNPVALDYLDDKILVLDYETGTVTEFTVTAYGRLIRDAVTRILRQV